MAVMAHVEDMRKAARRRLPRALFDYLEGGSFEQQTLAANRRDFESLLLRQKVLVDVGKRNLSVDLLGSKLKAPLILAPVGLCGLMRRDGEISAARAAQSSGIPYTLSTMSIASIEDLAEAKVPFWFQLYVWRDRKATQSLIERAAAAGCEALVVTVDLQALAQRHADLRNGLTVPPRLTMRNAFDMLRRPHWLHGALTSKSKSFGNIARYGEAEKGGVNGVMRWSNAQFDSSLSWSDVEWIRSLWPRKLIIKGILDPEDAATALKIGADAVVVSNHGGRQLDGTSSSIAALPRVRDRVGPDAVLIVDSGIRTGQDIMRALALGANACMVGRAYMYGLVADGEAGAKRAIRVLTRELDVSMALCGVRGVAELGREHLLS
jgi:L-lactate dehydrogenase (cytochrome)